MYDFEAEYCNGQLYLVPQRETQKQPPARKHKDRER